MRTTVLKEFFLGTASPAALAADLNDAWEEIDPKESRLRMMDDLTEDFGVSSAHLVSLCDAVLAGHVPATSLRAVGFGMIASDHFLWDGEEADGARVAETLHDWAAPDINYPLTPDTVGKFRHRLLTGRDIFVQEDTHRRPA